MRKLILLGALALPLLGVGVAQAAEPVAAPIPGDCVPTPGGLQCNGLVTGDQFLDYINGLFGS
jgi:hypothetical protein